jgi:serine/threonine protein kinase/beta-lactam-binding protein with PASTA domain
MPVVSEPLGRVLGNRYRLVAALGSGASAHVFLAEDLVLQRRVAVKVLQPALVHDESFLRRFRAEARSVAALNHPHVLRVFDWGEDDDGPYLVLEYLEGGSLHDMLARGRRLSIAQAARTGGQAADGLAYAHARGIVHRDVKPPNLLFDEDGRVRVADFGVARALAGSALTEPSGGMLGTARYASPEQAQGQPLDGRTDVYSLALVLCEAVTGEVPFSRDSPLATLQARIGAQLPADDALGQLWPLLADAAAPVVEDRPDAATFAARLEALADELSPGGPLPLVRRAPVNGVALGPLGDLHPVDPAATTRAGAFPAADLTLVGAGTAAAGAPTALGAAATTSLTPAAGRALPDTGEPTATVAPLDRSALPRFHRSPRRWPWVAAVAVLILAILAGLGVYAWKTKFFVPSRHVPSVVGESVAAARQKLVAEQFVVQVVAAVKSTTVSPGNVVREVPGSGAVLKQGSTVEIVPSGGLPSVAVPPLSQEYNCSVATQLLLEAHLKSQCPAAQTYSKTVATGDVISWSYNNQNDPRSAPYGATIAVTISKGKAPVTLTSFAGQSWTQADATLAADGLHPHESFAYSTTVGVNDVIGTTPPAGQSVPYGGTVTVSVSKGPQYVTVPTVIGLTVTKASQAIQAAGLTVGSVYGPATGKVFTTDPLKGQKEKVGTAVIIYTEPPPTGKTPPTGG